MRLKNWEERLQIILDRHCALPFGWGVSDCFKLPMEAVEAVTGNDPWGAIRYHTQKGAARQLRRHRCISVGDAFALKFEEIAPAQAGRGDIGVVASRGDLSGVVVLGAEVLGKAEGGIMRMPRCKLIRAFRVS